jgi:DNA-binding transcriptional MerR regulator
MPETLYNPHTVAQRLGVHSNSVRLWAGEFAGFLSLTANPTRGEYRKFTNADIAKLELIRDMRSRHSPAADIAAALVQLVPADIAGPVVPPQRQPDGPSALVPASAVVEALSAHLAALQRSLDARPSVDALQSAHTKGFAQGVTAAVLVIMLVLLVLGILSSLGIAWIVRLF